ncbi:MAG: hypothetical protein KIT84_38270 [Labilithrix sp.]|nr:hypothetical protein [Labilithrix sp.]MCW5816906.1 hypothetical protein [Labilithrix sp.]
MSITAAASANGRFPEAQQIATVPGSPNDVYLRTTFGVLVSHDAGKTWRWICERALGYDGQWDPAIAATKDGRLWVGLETGLGSTKDGCSFDPSPELEGETVKDITVDGKGETVFAITGRPGTKSHVWRRTPESGRFEKLAGLDDVNVMTIEVAPSNSARVYVSGQPYATIRGQIYRSDDGGATLKTDIGDGGAYASGLVAEGPFFIGAIDPADPSRLLVRHLHAKGSDLLLSKDGGKTFKNVLSIKSAMYGFAKSHDGKSYWAGSGLAEDGIFRSTDRGETFTSIAKHGVLCMHSAPGTLFVCENVFTYGAYTVATSHDDGATITPIARFTDVLGPVACDVPDARGGLCGPAWPETKALLEAPPDAGEEPPLDAGRRKKKRDGGARASSEERSGSKCGCEAVGSARPRAADLAWLIGALALVLRRHDRVSRTSSVDR